MPELEPLVREDVPEVKEVREHSITDDFGRRFNFTAQTLISESTDTAAGNKPQWLEVYVWRTEAGSFVVQRTTHYRVRHLHERCTRADGYDLVDATELDSYPCPACNRSGQLCGGFAQASRVNVEVYREPQELIDSFKVNGVYSNLARHILAELAEQDERIDEKWSTVVVP